MEPIGRRLKLGVKGSNPLTLRVRIFAPEALGQEIHGVLRPWQGIPLLPKNARLPEGSSIFGRLPVFGALAEAPRLAAIP